MKKKSKAVAKWVSNSPATQEKIIYCDVCGKEVTRPTYKRCSRECVEKRFAMEREAMSVRSLPCKLKEINIRCNIRSRGRYGQANQQDQKRRDEERKDEGREGHQETSGHGQETGQES